MDYQTALATLHASLRPANYVEIGCRQGASLQLAKCPSIAIDPDFAIRYALEAPTRIFGQTSDAFFAEHDLRQLTGGGFDLAFIDGMHNAEFALRDFINLERNAAPGAVIVVDDVLPHEMAWTTRERQTQAWTGDIYKLIPLLRRARPDLEIDVFDIEMKGLAVISRLDPSSTSLLDTYAAHEAFLLSPESSLPSVDAIRKVPMVRPAEELPAFARDLRVPARPGSTPEAQYLDLLKRSVLNETYLDDELRLLYLRDCLGGQETFDYSVYHDIRAARRAQYDLLAEARSIGRFPERDIHRCGFSHTMIGRKRIDSLHACLDIIRAEAVPGDFVECGIWRGGACMFMTGYARIHGLTERLIHVADSFKGLPAPSHAQDRNLDLSSSRYPELAVSEETVRENFAATGLPLDRVRFLKGWFKDTLPGAPISQIALLRLDGDLYESTMDALDALYPKVAPGGIVIVDDYNGLPMCRQAVIDYFERHDLPAPQVTEIDWTGVWWRKA